MSGDVPPPSSGGVSEVLAACEALYEHPDGAVQARADQWLIAFQKEKAAWQVSDSILQQAELPYNARFFAANTLRNKVLLDFSDLPDATSKLSFRDSLLNNIVKYKNAPPVLKTRLALTCGSLCVHLIGENLWPDALQSLVNQLGNSSETASILLEILECAAQECQSTKLIIPSNIRQQAFSVLRSYGEALLNLLFGFLTSSGSNRGLQKRVFACFWSWLRWMGLDALSPHHGLAGLLQNQLINATFQALAVDELFEVASDCICEFIYLASSDVMSASSPSVTLLFPKLIEMVPLLDTAANEDDEDMARRLCSLFVDMGEAFLPVITQNGPLSQAALEVLLKCSGYPDKRISSATFKFWYSLSENVVNSPGEVRASKISFLSPYYSRLLEELRRVMQYPSDLDTWDEDKRAASNSYRYDAADTLLDAANVLSINVCLSQIFADLCADIRVYQEDSSKWQPLESCLYCIRSIARKVDYEENQVLPKVFEIIPVISSNHHLRYTATLIVGRYGQWLSKNPQYLPSMLNFVVQGLNDSVVAPSAALALHHVCVDAAAHIAQSYLPQVFDIYKNSRKLSAEEQRDITGALCSALSALDEPRFMTAFEQLTMPIAHDLNNAITQIHANPASKDEMSAVVHDCLNRISEILKALDPTLNDYDSKIIPKGIAELLKKVWVLFEQVLNIYKNDERKMEKLIRCWKYCIKKMGNDFLPVFPKLADLVAGAFLEQPSPPFIYVLTQCANELGQIPAVQPRLLECCNVFSMHALNVLKTYEHFVGLPDLVEDFFSYLATLIRRCPDVLFSSPYLENIFVMSLNGLHVQHSASCVAIYDFLTTLVNEVTDEGKLTHRNRKSPAAHPNHVNHVNVVNSILSKYGQELINRLMAGVNGAVEPKRISVISALIIALLDLAGHPLLTMFKQAIAPFGETQYPSKDEFLRRLFESTNPMQMKEAIDHFASACRNRGRK